MSHCMFIGHAHVILCLAKLKSMTLWMPWSYIKVLEFIIILINKNRLRIIE